MKYESTALLYRSLTSLLEERRGVHIKQIQCIASEQFATLHHATRQSHILKGSRAYPLQPARFETRQILSLQQPTLRPNLDESKQFSLDRVL